jgi:uroporphyrinogen-III synthase
MRTELYGGREAKVVISMTRTVPPCSAIAKRQIDAVALTSQSGTRYLLEQAAADGNTDDVLHAFVSDVAAECAWVRWR